MDNDNKDKGPVSEPEKQASDKGKLKMWHRNALMIMLFDILAVNLSYFIALWARFDFVFTDIGSEKLMRLLKFAPIYTVLCILIFWVLSLYKSIWRYASFNELVRLCIAAVITTVLYIALINIIFPGGMPISFYLIGALLQFLLTCGIRFAHRFIILVSKNMKKDETAAANAMVIGAGSAGQMIIHDIKTSKNITDRVVCVIDDDSNKWGRTIDGAPITGGREMIMSSVEKYNVQKIYVAIPSAPAEERREILNICNETGCEMKNLPSMFQLMKGDVTVSKMKNVDIEDLLGRDMINLDLHKVDAFISGKVVLVTGGGGSIGSELCRQVAAQRPKQLIIFDIYENNAYSIQLELKERYPYLDLVVLIGSVRDSRRIFGVFKKYKPDIVYHAAAHKHVPLMECSPCEAIKNNAIGTFKTAYAAMVNGCSHFVLISTDKAVNPTNVMGASKRICEMVIQAFAAKIESGRVEDIPQLFTHKGYENADKTRDGEVFRNVKTDFVAVRFGNVLGSNGSVIPIFRKQIEKGGPVTVTHPDIIRYFMTIPEAVSLVMLAGTYAQGGEIFVLDMGQPVKIDTLARNLIRLSGFKPDVDIKIEYTGLRAGEKLYEEKLMAEEGLRKTENDLIHIGNPIPFDTDAFLQSLTKLMETAYANNENAIREQIAGIVTTYDYSGNQK